MQLDAITGPDDLRERSHEELDDLCGQIRARIIEAVTARGGHLGSNLGAVELTVALHRMFHSPHDVILWDTGHQAYVHKMLTGRAADFDSLRTAGGLAGYPSRAESPHDWIENSHASTVLSYAHGLATAFESSDTRRRVVAVVGDGALTGGMAFEGLNNIGHSGRNVIIVLNDNGRSYAPTVSRLSESLVRFRSNPKIMRRSDRLEEVAERIPWVGDTLQRGMKMSKAALRELWDSAGFFENLGVRYLGPFDGHDIAGLEEALSNAAQFDGPVVVHVLTQKGRGYGPAEEDTVKHMHDVGKVKPGTYTGMFSDMMVKLGGLHPEVVAITAAMPDSTGLLPFREHFGDRCIDVGIAEQHAVTSAVGMAMGGLRPFFAVYSTFLSRAFDQVNLDCGMHQAPVVFCIDRAGITGDDGPSHHGVLDMVLLTKVPGMVVLAPSSLQELERMMLDAMDMTGGPVAIRWPKTAARSVGPNEVGSGLQGPQGPGRRRPAVPDRRGQDAGGVRAGRRTPRQRRRGGHRVGSPGGEPAVRPDARRRGHLRRGGHRGGRAAHRRCRHGHPRRAAGAGRGRRAGCSQGPGARCAARLPPPRQARRHPGRSGPGRRGDRSHRQARTAVGRAASRRRNRRRALAVSCSRGSPLRRDR